MLCIEITLSSSSSNGGRHLSGEDTLIASTFLKSVQPLKSPWLIVQLPVDKILGEVVVVIVVVVVVVVVVMVVVAVVVGVTVEPKSSNFVGNDGGVALTNANASLRVEPEGRQLTTELRELHPGPMGTDCPKGIVHRASV